jgi:hypothetical protein
MELFFLLSGVGTWYALKSRRAGEYLWERVKRLLIPLFTVGIVLLLPIQVYFTLHTNAGYTGNFWQIYPRYFADFRLPRLTQYPGALSPIPFTGHLWFLWYLFLVSLIVLPLLLYLKSEKGQSLIARIAVWCDGRGGIFLFLIPLIAARLGLQGLFVGIRNWATLVWYIIFFVIGFMMGADKRFTGDIWKYGWICLVLWIVGVSGIALSVLALGYDPFSAQAAYTLEYVLYETAGSIMSWGAVVFVLSIGARYLNRNSKVLVYSNEAVLPFYLFHQTIILCVGWFVIRWNIGILLKLLIVALVSFPLILGLYEGLVRHFNGVRFLFGMKPRKRRILA